MKIMGSGNLVPMFLVGAAVILTLGPASAHRLPAGTTRQTFAAGPSQPAGQETNRIRCRKVPASCSPAAPKPEPAASQDARPDLHMASMWGMTWVAAHIFPKLCKDLPDRMLGACSRDVRELEIERRRRLRLAQTPQHG